MDSATAGYSGASPATTVPSVPYLDKIFEKAVKELGGPRHRRDAELLLEKAAGISREEVLAHPERTLPLPAARSFAALIARRRRHEPLPYLLGTAWFRGREFAVSRATLIPRPATEIIVEASLDILKKMPPSAVADIGTGSGAIAVSVAAENDGSTVIATDTSLPALRIARRNARRHGVADRIRFVSANLLPARKTKAFNLRSLEAYALLVVANLPYIPAGEMKKLPPEIRRYEPRSALVGGRDGLNHYRRLFTALARRPYKPRAIIIEILPKQYAPAAAALRRLWPEAHCERLTNPAGITVGLLAKLV